MGSSLRRAPPALRLALCEPQRPLRRVLATAAADVCLWFAERAKMVLPRDALPVLDCWERDLSGDAPPSIPGWRPEGPGRSSVDAAPLIAFLRARAEREEPFTFNALHLEPQGGRMYPFYITGYDGPITISKRHYQDAGKLGPRLLLAAIRRDVRALSAAPADWSLLELDFKSCACFTSRSPSMSTCATTSCAVVRSLYPTIGTRRTTRSSRAPSPSLGSSATLAIFQAEDWPVLRWRGRARVRIVPDGSMAFV